MKSPVLLLLLAVGASAGVRADRPIPRTNQDLDDAAALCGRVDGIGCRMNTPGSDRLVVYHRGFWVWEESRVPNRQRYHRRTVPAQYYPESAQGAVARYNLQRIRNRHADVLVTGGSPVAVVGQEIAREFDKERIVLVAHSGGYDGLIRTVAALGDREVEAIILLDAFYSQRLNSVAEYLRKHPNVKCSGFYTAHNEERYLYWFRPALGKNNAGRCDIRKEKGHNDYLAERIIAGMPARHARAEAKIATELDQFQLPASVGFDTAAGRR